MAGVTCDEFRVHVTGYLVKKAGKEGITTFGRMTDNTTPTQPEIQLELVGAPSTEATEKDILVMAVHTSHQDPNIAIKNQLPNSKEGSMSSKIKRICPDKVPTPVVGHKFKSDFVTALLDSVVQKSYISSTIAHKFGTPLNG